MPAILLSPHGWLLHEAQAWSWGLAALQTFCLGVPLPHHFMMLPDERDKRKRSLDSGPSLFIMRLEWVVSGKALFC
ncbi:hypothetical protein L873DRAFT_143805 [Choiromyces venosus 120613-1]|uniref:Uncharacterized protein n=1 Tax=Choiromyces venosus 120613-1 TaxID=1336337 RepID=A0A3N4J6R1_9PEZI|nr:hypothetical protein L873DRAFT_143805 [Choiromyces venosus 120613-1]